MQAVVLLSERRFFQIIRRTLSIRSHQTLGFCTQPPHHNSFDGGSQSNTEEEEEEEIVEESSSLCWRIERLSRGESVGTAFRSWMGDGFPVHRGDIFHTINRLRKRRFNKRALEVAFSLFIYVCVCVCAFCMCGFDG